MSEGRYRQLISELRSLAAEFVHGNQETRSAAFKKIESILAELAYQFQEGKVYFQDSVEVERFGSELYDIFDYLNRDRKSRAITEFLERILYSAKESPHPAGRDLYANLLSHLRGPLFHRADDSGSESIVKRDDAKRAEADKEAVDSALENIKKITLSDSDRVLFFIGAGASKPSPSDIPTVNELLPELWKRSSRLESKPLEKLQTWCKENNIENIEEMLTAITISNFIIKSPKVHGLLNSVLYPEYKSMTKVSLREIDSIVHVENMLNTFFHYS